MKTFEVELRALLTEEQHTALLKHFDKISTGEEDDAETYTFLTSNMNIKVKNQISRGKAKITVKKGAEYQQQADEYELPIDPTNVGKAVKLITALGFEKHIPSLQKRRNYQIGEITVSLKHETNWKYHVEAEIVVEKESDISAAKNKLEKFFEELKIKPMTEEETRALINSIITKYGLASI